MSRAEQKEATRQRILQAARACFEEGGFASTKIGDVAARAGVSPGSVMGHFADKSSLLAAAYHDELQAALDRAFATLPDRSVHAQLQHVAASLYRFFARDPGRELLREALFLEGEHGAAFQGWLTDLTARVTELLRQARVRRAEWVALGFFADWLGMLIAGLNGAFDDLDAQLAALDALTRLRVKP